MQSINTTSTPFLYSRHLFLVRIKHSSSADEVTAAIKPDVTTSELSLPLPARGRESSRHSTFPPIGHGLGVALELPVNLLWSLGVMHSRRERSRLDAFRIFFKKSYKLDLSSFWA